MLSAEHFALENEVVRNVLRIRQDEIQFFLDRFNSLITTSALIAGFTVTSLTALNNEAFSGYDTNQTVVQADDIYRQMEKPYLYAGAATIAFSLNSILTCTFASIWGPSLALRGPNGSVSKGYYALRLETRRAMLSFLATIVCFTIHICAAFFIIDVNKTDETLGRDPIICIVLILSVMGVNAYYLIRSGKTFKYERCDYLTPETAIINQKKTNDPSGIAPTNEDVKDKRSLLSKIPFSGSKIYESRSRVNEKNELFEHEGYLEKRGRRTGSLFGSAGQWQQRYFILRGTCLYGFKSKEIASEIISRVYGPEARHQSDEGERSFSSTSEMLISVDDVKKIALEGYEVMVDSGVDESGKYSFCLRRMDRSERDRFFRTTTKSVRDQWVHALVVASMTSQSTSIL